MITIIVVVLLLVILASDLIPNWNNMGVKDKILYCALMLISFGVLILYTFDVPIPTPTTPIINLIDALFPTLKQ